MTIGFVKLAVTEVREEMVNDPKGFSLVKKASAILQDKCKDGTLGKDEEKEGLIFGEEIIWQSLIEVMQTDDGLMLKKLAKLQPGSGIPQSIGVT